MPTDPDFARAPAALDALVDTYEHKVGPRNGAKVVARARAFLDEAVPLASGSHADVRSYTVEAGRLVPALRDPAQFVGYRGDAMAPLRDMADSLYAAGIRRIVGGVRLGADVFPGPTLGDGWMWDDLDTPDGAAVDELLFNDGVGVLHVTPASTPGQAPSVTTTPARSYPMVNVLARTVSAGDTVLLRADPLRAVKDTASNAMNVFGTIEVGDSAKLAIAFSSPDRAYLAALREALSDRGISVGDSATDTTAAVDSLVRVSSPTLRDILPAMLKPSQNQIAEMLLRTVALVSTGVGRADSARRVEREQLLAWGASPDGFVLRDGSGLTRYDLLSPETIMRVLDAIRRSPSYEDVYAALPVAGVDGTLKNRMRGATPGSVHAKTGSLTGVRALSGYITADDGRTLMFSIICNNFTTPVGLVLDVEDSLVTRLATLRVR